MNETTAILIYYTPPNSDRKTSSKINYINPSATNEQLKTLAHKLISLTNNTYEIMTRVITTPVI